ncbi:MAG: outer membrane protein assembly factor BamB family protein [Planctomycetota bacterium]|jgi:outer membrane protein assembly factor BamB
MREVLQSTNLGDPVRQADRRTRRDDQQGTLWGRTTQNVALRLSPQRSGRSITDAGVIPIAVVILGFLASQGIAQKNWTSFRNDGSGTIEVTHAPIQWAPNSNISWRTQIHGYGQSAPVVWDGTVFLTSCDGPWQEHGYVHAYELKTGRKRWSTEVSATTRVENFFRNSRAAPTCVVDARIVVSFFPGGDVTAMDHQGNIIWSVPLFQKFQQAKNERGTASSLAQSKDFVFVLVDHHGPSYLIALRKKDGSVAWKVDRGNRVPSWSSPVIATHEGHEMIIASSSDTVDAYSTHSGDLLWQVKGLQGNHIPSASLVGSSIFVGSTQLAQDGSANAGKVAASNCRIDLTQNDGKPTYAIRWSAERAKSHYSTPLAFAGYVYYVSKSGVLYCCSAESGELLFRKRIGDPCWASAMGVRTPDGQSLAYFVMKNGETLILRPGRTFDEVARNTLWDEEQMQVAAAAARRQRVANQVPQGDSPRKEGPEQALAEMPESTLHRMFSYGDPTVYAAALVEGCLLIRTGQHLYCVGGQ